MEQRPDHLSIPSDFLFIFYVEILASVQFMIVTS